MKIKLLKDVPLFKLSMTHTSYGNEFLSDRPVQERNNERLEFLGDAILDAVVSEWLMKHYPDTSEGMLSKERAKFVNELALSQIATMMNIGDYLELGKGEKKSGGQKKESILAGAFEAYIAAVYLHKGYEFTRDHLIAILEDQQLESMVLPVDYKSLLQEYFQKEFPEFSLQYQSEIRGDAKLGITHFARLDLGKHGIFEGEGKYKKAAEQEAAKNACYGLKVLRS